MANEKWAVLRAQCVPPRITTSKHQHYSTHQRRGTRPHSGHSSCKASGMLPFLLLVFYCAKIRILEYFLLFDIFIPNPMASYPSTAAHSFDIRIPVVAQCSPFKLPTPVFASTFPCRCRYIAVAPYPTSGKETLGILRQLCGNLEPGKMRSNAVNGHSNYSDTKAGWMDEWIWKVKQTT